MRVTNKTQILRCIREKDKVSKREIAEELGLSATTVSTFIRELEKEKKIKSCGIAESTGGRRSILYDLNPDFRYILGIDLEVDRLIGVVLDFKGKIKGTKEISFTSKDEWKVIPLLKTFIYDLFEENDLPIKKFGGLGIGVPGVVNSDTGVIEFAPNLGWKNVNIPSLLGIGKPVFIENEANAGALGEAVFGVAKNVSHLVFISVGMGIGCGLIINNKLYSGSLYHAGEFGHMIVNPDGLPCQCGNKGCWEVYASNNAAIRMYKEKSNRKVTFQEILAEFTKDHSFQTVEVVQSITKYLGIGIANIINGLNPEMVVVGGEITVIKDLVYNELLKGIKGRSLEKSFSGVRLEFSQLGNKATALGMGSIVIEKIISSIM